MAALEAFAAGPWGRKYPAIAPAWRRNWDKVIPFFAFPEEVPCYGSPSPHARHRA
jgi:putative transposase